MKFIDLLEKVSGLPAFTVKFLAAGEDLKQVRLQISRWVQDGKVIRIHKGLYTLAEPYRKVNPDPFYIANALKKASYVSLQSALAWYGMIPEFVPSVTSITTGRPQTIETPLGRFEYRHVSKKYFWGYKVVELKNSLPVFIASPEKALLDLIYLTTGSEQMAYLEELRLQKYEEIDRSQLSQFAQKYERAKMTQALRNIEETLDRGEGIQL